MQHTSYDEKTLAEQKLQAPRHQEHKGYYARRDYKERYKCLIVNHFVESVGIFVYGRQTRKIVALNCRENHSGVVYNNQISSVIKSYGVDVGNLQKGCSQADFGKRCGAHSDHEGDAEFYHRLTFVNNSPNLDFYGIFGLAHVPRKSLNASYFSDFLRNKNWKFLK